jgi:hypothetical protein
VNGFLTFEDRSGFMVATIGVGITAKS